MFHLTLHFIVPAIVALQFFHNRWQMAYLLMMATMLVDLDHLISDPIYDAGRCSIGFHPLHQPWFTALYLVMSFLPKTRQIGLGLMIHMVLDSIDCQVTNGIWIN